MKIFIFALVISFSALAEDYKLVSGSGTYTVKHLIKRVQATSHDVKGKVSCPDKDCEFLLAAPIKTFISSDGNRDENMQVTTESGKYPLTTASGKISKEDFLKKGSRKLPVVIEFHGIKQNYVATLNRIDDKKIDADIILKLTSHKIERPSLFGVSIDDEVPLHFELNWSPAL